MQHNNLTAAREQLAASMGDDELIAAVGASDIFDGNGVADGGMFHGPTLRAEAERRGLNAGDES